LFRSLITEQSDLIHSVFFFSCLIKDYYPQKQLT